MSRLLNKDEINDYVYKAYLLKENDWETWYHEDNWVHKIHFESPYGPDRAGCSTDVAFSSLGFTDKEYEEIKKELIKTNFNPSWSKY